MVTLFLKCTLPCTFYNIIHALNYMTVKWTKQKAAQQKHRDTIICLIIVKYTVLKRIQQDDNTTPVSDIVQIYAYRMIYCIHFCTIFYQIFHHVNMPCRGCHTKCRFDILKQNFTTIRDLIRFCRRRRREQVPRNNF